MMMSRPKVKANTNQLCFHWQQMALHPDTGLSNIHTDQRWADLKGKLDGLGVIRSLEQWKKSWKDQEKYIFGSTITNHVPQLQPSMQGSSSPCTNNASVIPANINANTNSTENSTAVNRHYLCMTNTTSAIQVAMPTSNVTAASTVTQSYPDALSSNDQKPTPTTYETPLPTHLFSVSVIKTDTSVIEDNYTDEDDDIKYVGYSLGMINLPSGTLLNSNKENVQVMDINTTPSQSSTSNNEIHRRGIKRSSQVENTTIALAAMQEHNIAMKNLQETTNNRRQRLKQQIKMMKNLKCKY